MSWASAYCCNWWQRWDQTAIMNTRSHASRQQPSTTPSPRGPAHTATVMGDSSSVDGEGSRHQQSPVRPVQQDSADGPIGSSNPTGSPCILSEERLSRLLEDHTSAVLAALRRALDHLRADTDRRFNEVNQRVMDHLSGSCSTLVPPATTSASLPRVVDQQAPGLSGSHRTILPLASFDGSTPWDAYIAQFNIVAEHNGWDARAKYSVLVSQFAALL